MPQKLFFFLWILTFFMVACDDNDDDDDEEETVRKPIIYLYPEEVTDVTVQFEDLETLTLTTTYPTYGENGWQVTAFPDGTLISEGMEYYALYWEGRYDVSLDMDTGFVVPRNESAVFLEDSLEKLGLTRREADEFIVYWLPELEANAYNFIHFSTSQWSDLVPLRIEPSPDTFIRVMMYVTPLEAPFQATPQQLSAPPRNGFVAVEWGGAVIYK